MKHVWRKPLLPVVLIVVMLLGIVFMGMFRRSINEDKKTIEEIYLNADLSFSVLPGISSSGTLEFPVNIGNKIEALEEVEKCFYYETAYYSLREPIAVPGLSMIYGTNAIDDFEKTQELKITWKEGYDSADFQVLKDEKVPCLIEESLMEIAGIELGDEIVIAPNEGDGTDKEKAPSFTMEIVGSYQNEKGKVSTYSLIVTNRIFLSEDGRFLYNNQMMQDFFFYNAFQISIKPLYNREFERVEELLEEKIGTDYILYSNARVLKQAVRPLEQKVALQEKMVLPIGMMFALASCVIVYLTVISFRTEVFLRLLWGEKRRRVFGKITLSLCPVLVLAFLLGCLLIVLIGNGTADRWLLAYFMAEITAVLFTTAVVSYMISRQNLIFAYQAREE